MPGMPPQVLCYERADDIGFGVSGVVTRARGLRATFPDLDPNEIPMAAPVTEEKVVYLLDPIGASRRSLDAASGRRLHPRLLADCCPSSTRPSNCPGRRVPAQDRRPGPFDGPVHAVGRRPGAEHRHGPDLAGHAGRPRRSSRTAKSSACACWTRAWTSKASRATASCPGMDIHAALTVVGDGPVGPVGQQLDAHFGLPEGHHTRDWAVGMKFVVDLPDDTALKPGTVLHTFGFPEPEIFGFLYVHPDRVASLGIFVPSWFDSPVRTAYRYLQHWMLHPYLWRHLKGGKLRSWGAKTLANPAAAANPTWSATATPASAKAPAPPTCSPARAWMRPGPPARNWPRACSNCSRRRSRSPGKTWKPPTSSAAARAGSKPRRRVAEKSRDGFQKGVVRGMIGMALAGLTNGRFTLSGEPVPPYKRIPTLEEYYRGRIPAEEIEQLRKECAIKGVSLHGALMQRCGWPAIPYDGQLLVSHQDALLLGGKVQAPPGYADHVVFLYPELCERCGTKICIELCSGQAITPGAGGVPAFDREKCVHCGACYWNCAQPIPGNPERMNIAFRAGTGGLHSAEN